MRCMRFFAARLAVGWCLALAVCVAPSLAAGQTAEGLTTREEVDRKIALGLTDVADLAIRKIKDVDDWSYAMEETAYVLAQLGEYDQARGYARSINTEDAKGNILEEIAAQQARTGAPDASIATLEGIKDPKRKIDAYIGACDALLEVKRNTEAILLMQHAAEVKLPADMDPDDKSEYIVLIGWSFARAGAVGRTSAMIAAISMEESFAEDAKAGLFAVVNAYTSDLSKAKRTVEHMPDSAAKDAALRAIADVALHSGDTRSAMEAYREVIRMAQNDDEVPTDAIRRVANALHELEDDADARETIRTWYDAMVKQADEGELADIAITQAKVGDIAGATKTMDRIKTFANRVEVLEEIVARRASTGDLESPQTFLPDKTNPYKQALMAVGVAKGMLRSIERAAAKNAAPEAELRVAAAGPGAQAGTLIRQAQEAVLRITERENWISAWEAIATARFLAGDEEGARRIARGLGTDASKAHILEVITAKQIVGSNVEAALETLAGIKDPLAKGLVSLRIAETLVDAGKREVALQMLARVPNLPLDFHKASLSTIVMAARALARVGAPAPISQLAATIKGKDPLDFEARLALTAFSCAAQNDLVGARAALEQMQSRPFKGAALEVLAAAQLRAGAKQEAADTYKRWLNMVAKTGDEQEAILRIAHLQLGADDFDGARATLQRGLETGFRNANDAALGKLATGQAEAGDLEGAAHTLDLIQEASEQRQARGALARAKASRGEMPEAMALAPKDTDPYGQTIVLTSIARGLLDSGRPPAKSPGERALIRSDFQVGFAVCASGW